MYPVLKTKYFTFQEVLNLYPSRAPSGPHSTSMASNWFMKMLEDAGLEPAIYTLSDIFTDELLGDIINALMTIVYDRHDSDYLYSVTSDVCAPSYTLQLSDFPKAIKGIINVINLTIPRYAPLLQQNELYSMDPVAPIGSRTTGRNRFNDTPQDEGEYNDEDHASNVSKSYTETEVDSGSIMERLEQLFKGFKSIILDWSNEFNQLFFKEEQII